MDLLSSTSPSLSWVWYEKLQLLYLEKLRDHGTWVKPVKIKVRMRCPLKPSPGQKPTLGCRMWPHKPCPERLQSNKATKKCPHGGFLKWWYPQNTPKWSFLVGKPLVVGYHHFRKPLHVFLVSSIIQPKWSLTKFTTPSFLGQGPQFSPVGVTIITSARWESPMMKARKFLANFWSFRRNTLRNPPRKLLNKNQVLEWISTYEF